MDEVAAGWYPDHDDAAMQRYWDGRDWTDQRRATDDPKSPDTISSTVSGRIAGRGLGAARRLTDSARQSGAAQRLSSGAASAGRTIANVATDQEIRATAVASAAPTFNAALDGAGLRNKKGKVKVWRIARAATHPRKSVTRATTGAANAAAGQVADSARASLDRISRVAPTDQEIIAEWRLLTAEDDLRMWQQGQSRFAAAEISDAAEMRASAFLLCEGLKHCLVGTPPFENDDTVVETIGNVLASALLGASSGEWDEELARPLRLGLAVARRFGVQPEELGGNGELDNLFEPADNRMRMAMALSPNRWSCDMSLWFAEAA